MACSAEANYGTSFACACDTRYRTSTPVAINKDCWRNVPQHLTGLSVDVFVSNKKALSYRGVFVCIHNFIP